MEAIFSSEKLGSIAYLITCNGGKNGTEHSKSITVVARYKVQTLGTWVQIPLEAKMLVCVDSVFALHCVRSSLATANPSPKESYWLCIGLRNCKTKDQVQLGLQRSRSSSSATKWWTIWDTPTYHKYKIICSNYDGYYHHTVYATNKYTGWMQSFNVLMQVVHIITVVLSRVKTT
jgi:hypothetical protein